MRKAAQNASTEEYKNSVDPKMAEYVDKVRAGEKLDAENRTERQATGSATKGSGVKYSIQTGDDGKKFVQVDGDFLKDVPEENWKNTARDAIRDLFPDDFERGG